MCYLGNLGALAQVVGCSQTPNPSSKDSDCSHWPTANTNEIKKSEYAHLVFGHTFVLGVLRHHGEREMKNRT